MECAERVLGRRKRKHRDWFDDQRDDIKQLLDERNRRIEVYLRNASPENHALLREARSELQRELRRMKENWWSQLAEKIQGYADTGNLQEFYSALKGVYGAKHRAFCPVRGADGRILITDKTEILSRWAEHYRDLLNRFTPTDPNFAESLPELPLMEDLDRVQTLAEVRDATLTLKSSKAPGPDSVPAEVLRYGGDTVLWVIHTFIDAAWRSGCIPQQWRDADLVSIYKGKGDRAVCRNSRGISLLAAAGKVLTKIMLLRLVSSVSELILPESQFGFRRDRSTVDMVFVLKQLQEKCIEQHQELYMVFVDLTRAFDAVNRPLLWEVLQKFGCPPKFLSILGALHDGAMVRVVGEGGKSEQFLVTSGVRHGCVIAPVMFNLFVAAVMIAAKQRLDLTDVVKFIHRMDGNLFNLRRLQARTLVTHESVL